MTLVIPEGYASVIHSLRFSGDPQPMAITYGIEATGESTGTLADQIAADCHTAFGALVAGTYDGEWQLNQTEVKLALGGVPPDFEIGVASNVIFGNVDAYNQLPVNSAYLTHKRTSRFGRRGRGRFYLPGVGEAGVSDLGVLTGPTRAAIQARLDTLREALVASAVVTAMVLLHDQVNGGASLTPDRIIALVLDEVIATQRRRLRS